MQPILGPCVYFLIPWYLKSPYSPRPPFQTLPSQGFCHSLLCPSGAMAGPRTQPQLFENRVCVAPSGTSNLHQRSCSVLMTTIILESGEVRAGHLKCHGTLLLQCSNFFLHYAFLWLLWVWGGFQSSAEVDSDSFVSCYSGGMEPTSPASATLLLLHFKCTILYSYQAFTLL